MKCAHCGNSRRDVTLWRQLMALSIESTGTVCCWLSGVK